MCVFFFFSFELIQSLKNVSRYKTEELITLQNKLSQAATDVDDRQLEIFTNMKDSIFERRIELQKSNSLKQRIIFCFFKVSPCMTTILKI